MTEIRPLLDYLQFVPSPRGRGLGRGQSHLERRYPDFQKNHPSKRIQTKEIVGHGCPTLFLNFKGLKNE